MHCWRSLNLELIHLDPEIDRTLRKIQRALVESEIRSKMGDQRDNIPENVEQPRCNTPVPYWEYKKKPT
jgi:hypothetical protein